MHEQEGEPPDWDPVSHIVRSFEQLFLHERERLDRLLHRCDERFHPLADPLRLTLTDHRWFNPRWEREESYSDWLCWLIAQFDSSEQILRLFGLSDTEFGRIAHGRRRTSLTREESIQCGGETG